MTLATSTVVNAFIIFSFGDVTECPVRTYLDLDRTYFESIHTLQVQNTHILMMLLLAGKEVWAS